MSTDSGTPRTDALLAASPIGFGIAPLCRELEREAAALRADRDALADALRALYDDYKKLADSGDAGNWSIEDQAIGIATLQAISQHGGTK